MSLFRTLMVLSCMTLALIAAAYSIGDGDGRADFTYVNSAGIGTLDPASITWKQDIRVASNIWEGLTILDPRTGAPIAGAAELPEISADGLTYTFSIRLDARWSNGDAVTAGDFVRGWRRAIEPGSAGDYAFFLTDHVVGARAYYEWRTAAVADLSSSQTGSDAWRARFSRHAALLDERFAGVGFRAVASRTFEVRLVAPCSYFLDLCAFVALLPIHESIEDLRIDCEGSGITAEGLVVYDPQWTKPDYDESGYPGLITNGPYLLDAWAFQRRLRMRVNPYFRRSDSLSCRTIDMAVYGDLNAAILAYEAGDVDFLPEMDVSYGHELAGLAMSGARPDFYNPAVFATYFYLFNCADATVEGRRNPFVDARVRKAFVLALDRRLIAERVVGRGERPSGNVVPLGCIAGYDSPRGLEYDPDEARRLLADAGYPGGEGLGEIDLLYNTGFIHERVCTAMAEMWKRELGVAVVLRGKEAKTFSEDRKQRRFMIARAGWYGDYGDPTTFLDLFATGNGNNDSGHSDAKYDDLLREAAQETNIATRLSLLAAAESRIIRETLPALPLYQATQMLAINPRVSGLYPNARLVFPFRYVTTKP